MKLSKTLITTAILGFSLAFFHYTAWADTPEQKFQQGLESAEKGDYQTAIKLWKQLAEQGSASAQFNLGIMYSKGYGVKQDYTEAAKWNRKAAEQGSATAQHAMGLFYSGIYSADVIKEDLSKAKEWFRKACDNGSQYACDDLRKLEK